MNKEFIYVRPHVARYIEYFEKHPKIILSVGTPLAAHVSLLMANERKANIDQSDLPPQYKSKIEVVIDLPILIKFKKFYITNCCNIAIDLFCHQSFLQLAAFQMEMATNLDLPRKEARMAFLNRLKMSTDEIDEETVRRLVDFTRPSDSAKRQRITPRVSNNAIVGHILKNPHKRQTPSDLSVLSLFE